MDAHELRELCEAILPSMPAVNTAYLFGSRAKGLPSPRDYDIAILLDERHAPTREDIYRASDSVWRLLHARLRPLDVVEMNVADDLLVTEVLRCRCVLYCADSAYRVAWETRRRYRVWDMAPLRALYEEAAFRRVREMDIT